MSGRALWPLARGGVNPQPVYYADYSIIENGFSVLAITNGARDNIRATAFSYNTRVYGYGVFLHNRYAAVVPSRVSNTTLVAPVWLERQSAIPTRQLRVSVGYDIFLTVPGPPPPVVKNRDVCLVNDAPIFFFQIRSQRLPDFKNENYAAAYVERIKITRDYRVVC